MITMFINKTLFISKLELIFLKFCLLTNIYPINKQVKNIYVNFKLLCFHVLFKYQATYFGLVRKVLFSFLYKIRSNS